MGERTNGLHTKPASFDWQKAFWSILPYLAIAASTIAVFYIWIVNPFLTGGDDFTTHLGIVYDLAYGFKHGFVFSTNHVYLGIFAYNTSLFYGMLPHYCAAVLDVCFGFAGANIIGSMKAVSILFAFLGGVYAYKLFYRVSGNRVIGMAGGIAFCFLPYRIYCYMYRFAWSEAIALNFMPMFFYAIYALLHDDRLKVGPFVTLVVSLALSVVSHPFTSILTLCGGAILALCNLKLVIRKVKDWRFDVYLGCSVLLEIGMVFFFVFPMLQATSSGLYRVSYDSIMWTTLEHIIWSFVQTNQFSGLLNFEWAAGIGISVTKLDAAAYWIVGLILFPLLCALSYIADWLIDKKVPLDWKIKLPIRMAASFAILFVPLFIIGQRIEVFIAMGIYYGVYVLAFMLPIRQSATEGRNIRESLFDLAKDGSFYACVILASLGFLYLYTSFIWEVSPSVLYTAQFAFRFWGITSFTLLFLFILVVKAFAKYRAAWMASLMLSAYLFTLCMGVVDKRIYNVEHGYSQSFEPDQSWIEGRYQFGSQNEYMPQIIYDIYYGDAELSYPDSQAKAIGTLMIGRRKVLFGEDSYLAYLGMLDGDFEVKGIENLNTPDVDISISAASESLLQIPQFYYEGYKATAVYEDGEKVSCEISNVDGLVAISLPEGDYTLEIRYPGPALRIAGFYILGFSIAGVIAMGLSTSIGRRIAAGKARNSASKIAKD